MKLTLSKALAFFHVVGSVLLQVQAEDPFSWDLVLNTPGYLVDPPISDGVEHFFTSYNVTERDYTVEVFKTDCSTASAGLPIVSQVMASDKLDVTFLYNQSLVQTSNLWTANTTGGDVDFCIKVSLFSNTTLDSILFNFIETIYKIQVDLTTGFSTSVDLVRTAAGDGGVETIDLDENITVYQCNDTYDEITAPPALTQGDSLLICVETEEDSAFEVGKIKDVTIDQNGTKSFDYVTEYVDSYWATSACIATNTSAAKCKVEMMLLGDYFEDAEPTDLTVTGFVKMDYLGRRRRKLMEKYGPKMGSMMSRKLETENRAAFSLDVSIGGEAEAAGTTSDEGMGESPDMNSMESSANALYGSILALVMIAANMML